MTEVNEISTLRLLEDAPRTFEQISEHFGFEWALVATTVQNLIDEGKVVYDPKTGLLHNRYVEALSAKIVALRTAVYGMLGKPMRAEEVIFSFPKEQELEVAMALDHLYFSGIANVWEDGRICSLPEDLWRLLN